MSVQSKDFSKLTSGGSVSSGHDNRFRIGLRSRKNLGQINDVISEAFDSGAIKPDCVIYSRGLREMLGEETIAKMFTRSGYCGDDHGPTRSLGDLLGGHGMGFRKVGVGKFLCPQKLPVISGNTVYEEPVY